MPQYSALGAFQAEAVTLNPEVFVVAPDFHDSSLKAVPLWKP